MNGTLKRITPGLYESVDHTFRVELTIPADKAKPTDPNFWTVFHTGTSEAVYQAETIGEVKKFVATGITAPTKAEPKTKATKLSGKRPAKPMSDNVVIAKYIRETDPEQFKNLSKQVKSKSLEIIGRHALEVQPDLADLIPAF